MKRGEIWTISGGSDYAGKPRPFVILQSEKFDVQTSVTVCGFTTNRDEAPFFRILVEPSIHNGLRSLSHLMADKITTVNRTRLGKFIGRLDSADMARLSRAIAVFLDLNQTPSEPRP